MAAVVVASTTVTLSAEEIRISSILLKLIEQAEVPARTAGVVRDVVVQEGEMVVAGAVLAQIDDADVQLERQRAQLELSGASKQAENDVKVRFAKKSLEVAEAEVRRALDSEKRYPQSVSQSELEHLQLVVQRTSLEIEQAQRELEMAQSVRQIKENELQVAELGIQQRQVRSPLSGFVVQVHRRRGEWVQPGQTIVRILRLDRLRAEGLVNAQEVHRDLQGRRVAVTVQLDNRQNAEFVGAIVFVSPEIDPVNGQVRVLAEIENRDLKLRPGLKGSMVIHPQSQTDQGR